MSSHHDDESLYPDHLVAKSKEAKRFGKMNDPTAASYLEGPCGDEMEFYLAIRDNKIEDIKFYTEGCVASKVCGMTVADLSVGKSIMEALGISPKQVMEELKDLPKGHSHCSILAVSALYRAIADYWLKP